MSIREDLEQNATPEARIIALTARIADLGAESDRLFVEKARLEGKLELALELLREKTSD